MRPAFGVSGGEVLVIRKLIAGVVLVAVAVAGVGCSNSADKGKNKEKDVPKAAKSE
jgi:hypothetical protein